jgi:phospholipid:diacylglycerol acyltransferase
MKIYCLYGYGKETERSYWYMQGEYEQDESRSDGVDETAFVSLVYSLWLLLMVV